MLRLRRMLAALLLLGLLGTATELVFLQHYEDLLQFVPLVLIAAALVALAWQLSSGSVLALRVLRAVMVAVAVAGAAGVIVHFRANLQFQLEVDPEMPRRELMMKAIHATAPPALAPGAMVQLGLLGLIYAYRDRTETRSI